MKTRSKSRIKTLEPPPGAAAILHPKLDAIVRANSRCLPLVTDTINFAYAYKDTQRVPGRLIQMRKA